MKSVLNNHAKLLGHGTIENYKMYFLSSSEQGVRKDKDQFRKDVNDFPVMYGFKCWHFCLLWMDGI